MTLPFFAHQIEFTQINSLAKWFPCSRALALVSISLISHAIHFALTSGCSDLMGCVSFGMCLRSDLRLLLASTIFKYSGRLFKQDNHLRISKRNKNNHLICKQYACFSRRLGNTNKRCFRCAFIS